jgi:hypothetical protein
MIERGLEGLYIFHRGEEKGCLGSRWIVENTPDLVKGIDAAIAFDRAGKRDIITHQSFGMTASDEFALSLADQLNRTKGLDFRPDDTGVYTDTNEYADLIAECSNVSVGYDCNHGPNETLDVYHVEQLLKAVCSLDVHQIVIKRQPGEGGWQSYMGSSYRSSMAGSATRIGNARIADLIEVITHCPDAAALLLYEAGYNADDVWDAAFEGNLQDDPYDTDSDLDRALLGDGDGEADAPFAENCDACS